MAEIKAWITVKGRHIPIMEGESKEDAIKRLKEGARKGKSTRPIAKEQYEEKKKATEKSFKGWEEHKDRVRNADKRLEKDTSDAAKKEKLNADRTLKEAQQRYRKHVTEQEEAMKHPKYTSIKVKKGEKKEDFVVDYKIPDKLPTEKKPSASAKRKQAIKQMIQEKGIENLGTPKTQEEAKQLLKSWQDKDAEVKAKQIANAEEQKAERNAIRHYGSEIEDEQFRKDALAEMRRYKNNWDFYTAKEKQNIAPNGIKELDARINEIEEYEKKLKSKNGEPKKSHVWTAEDKERWEVREAFARGDISPEEAKAYGFTDEQLKAIKDMGRREALERVAEGKNKSAYIDPMGNFNTAKSRSKYEINHNEDFRDMSKESARQELDKMRKERPEVQSITKQVESKYSENTQEVRNALKHDIEELRSNMRRPTAEQRERYNAMVDRHRAMLHEHYANVKNTGGVEKKTDRNKEKVKALRTMAENAEIRKIVTSEQAFEGKQASWAPKTGDKINDVGHNEAQNKLYDAPTGTTFEMTSRDGDYVGEYTKQSDGSWKGSQKYKSGYKMPPTVYTPKGFAMNVVGKDIKVINDGSEKKADWRDVDTKPQKSKKVNLSATYTNAMNSADTDKVERAIAKLTNNGGSSTQIQELKEKLRRLRHSEYKEDPAHYNGKGMR